MYRNFFSRVIMGSITAMVVFGFSHISQAEAPTIDFDQGIEIGQIIKKAVSKEDIGSSPGNGRMVGLIPMRTPDPLPEELKESHVLAPPWFYGPWQTKIYNHPSYQRALKYPPLVRQLPDNTRIPLEEEWRERISEGNSLVGRARELEPADKDLYTEAVWIQKEKKYLDDESEGIDVARTQYRNRCWVEKPPSNCEAERGRLNDRIGQFNTRVGVYNDRLGKWKSERDRVKGKGEELDQNIAAWGHKVDAYSNKAEQALESAGWSAVNYHAQGDDMRGKIELQSRSPGAICISEGLSKLKELMALLTARQRSERDKEAITRANNFVRTTDYKAPPLLPRTFQNQNRRIANARIDIEIVVGRAFVFCPVILKLRDD